MIIGIGIDIINIKRIEKIINKYGIKFILKCFAKNEIERSEENFNTINSYAKRYAAKEACAKALGTGLARGVYWKDITVENNIYGKPTIILHRIARKRLKELSSKPCRIDVSLSDEKNFAIANVLISQKNEIQKFFF